MGKKSFFRNRLIASTGLLAAGALAVYGVWQLPSMNDYHMESLPTPITDNLGANTLTEQEQNPVQSETTPPLTPAEEPAAQPQEEAAQTGSSNTDGQIEDTTEEEPKETNTVEDVSKKEEKKTDKKKTVKKQKAKEASASNKQQLLSEASFDENKGLSWPVKGDIVLNYDTEGVVYFQTLAQYKANPAIMIAGKEGGKVKAAAAGVVSDVSQSEEYGTMVTMSVGSDYEIVYGQLKDLKVQKGDTVEEGAVLGKLSAPTDFFAVEGTNLYFQILQDGKPVNPLLMLS